MKPINKKSFAKFFIDLNEAVYKSTGKHGFNCNLCNYKVFGIIHNRNKILKLFGFKFPFVKEDATKSDWQYLHPSELDRYTIKDIEKWQCSESELFDILEPYYFLNDLIYKQKYKSVQSIHLYEAFEIFQDDLYDLIIDHLNAPDSSKETRRHYDDLLKKFKRYMSKEEVLDIERAKQYPIIDLVRSFSTSEVSFNRNTKCILHHDKTASMKLYQETNSYYCFGCNEGGDVIDMIMNKMNIDFVAAVKWLT